MSGTITPSPSASFASTPFLDSEKADIRRFCGYPTYGSGSSGFSSWRFFTWYGELEYRMNNLTTVEIQNVRYYLSGLYQREAELWGSSANLDTDKAAVWTRNRSEVSDRTRLLDQIARALCDVLGVPPGPGMGNANSGAIVI